MNRSPTTHSGTQPQISLGPVSRTVRVLLAAVTAWLTVEWATAGMDWFVRSSTPSNPWVWIVAAVAVYYGLYQLPYAASGRQAARRTVIVAAVAFATAAVASLMSNGGIWEPPLTGLLYGFELGFLATVTLAHLTAVVLGTPGCEMGGLAELIHRLRGTQPPNDEPMWCLMGLHHLDQWETHQPWRTDRP